MSRRARQEPRPSKRRWRLPPSRAIEQVAQLAEQFDVHPTKDRTAKPGVGDGHHLLPMARGFVSAGRGARLVQPPGADVARIDHHGSGILRRDAAGRIWLATASQTSSIPTRVRSSPARPSPTCSPTTTLPISMDGKGALARQRLRRTAVAQRQIRGGISARLRQRFRGPCLAWPLLSTSTIAAGRMRALTTPRQIKPTSPRCHSAWQPDPGRGSTYRRGKYVQTTGTTSSYNLSDKKSIVTSSCLIALIRCSEIRAMHYPPSV